MGMNENIRKNNIRWKEERIIHIHETIQIMEDQIMVLLHERQELMEVV
jgi:hypothetical protein